MFAPLALTQAVVRKWVGSATRGKVVFISRWAACSALRDSRLTPPTKHAIEAIAEAMQPELRPFGIQVQTINPGAYLTGFNEAMAENAFRWLDDSVNFTSATPCVRWSAA